MAKTIRASETTVLKKSEGYRPFGMHSGLISKVQNAGYKRLMTSRPWK